MCVFTFFFSLYFSVHALIIAKTSVAPYYASGSANARDTKFSAHHATFEESFVGFLAYLQHVLKLYFACYFVGMFLTQSISFPSHFVRV
jgi:hypothetical protein